MPYTIETTHFGLMPNQAEGSLNGRRYYWRARHGSWRLRVGDDNPASGEIIDSGDDDGAGWWENEECLKRLTAILEKHSHG